MNRKGRDSMKKVNVFLADGFEEIEGLTVVDLLRRAGIEVEMVSIMDRKKVTGSHGIVVKADKKFQKDACRECDMLVLPGGLPGTDHLRAHKGLRKLIKEFYKEDKWLAAICAAPTVFGELGLLEGKKATCYPAMEEGLIGAEVVKDGAVTDGHIITGRGMGVSAEFALQIVEALLDKETADKLAEQVVYQRPC